MTDTTLLAPLTSEALSIHTDMSQDEVMEILNHIAFMREEVKAIYNMGQSALLEYIQANGSFEFNGNTYTAGKTKSVKCIDQGQCLEAVLEATGGDVDAIKKVLSTDAFKPTATMAVLGKAAEDHFTTTWGDKVVTKKIPTNLLEGKTK